MPETIKYFVGNSLLKHLLEPIVSPSNAIPTLSHLPEMQLLVQAQLWTIVLRSIEDAMLTIEREDAATLHTLLIQQEVKWKHRIEKYRSFIPPVIIAEWQQLVQHFQNLQADLHTVATLHVTEEEEESEAYEEFLVTVAEQAMQSPQLPVAKSLKGLLK